jgi:hypothetical protein
MAKKYDWPRVLRQCAWDALSVGSIAAFLLACHLYLDRRPLGEHIEAFEYAVLQSALLSDAGASRAWRNDDPQLPVVIDISPIRLDKSLPTDRQKLAELVDTLEAMHAAAIGLDIDFSPDDSGQFITPADPQLFARWKSYGNVRIGVFRRAGDIPERWLGHPDFKTIAAGMLLPPGNSSLAMQFSSPDLARYSPGVPIKHEDYLLQMPAALSEVLHPGSRAQLVDNPDVTHLELDARIRLGQFPVDYSFLQYIQRIPYRAKADLDLWHAEIFRRAVIIGDMKDPDDSRCTQVRGEAVPGSLIHASALATLNHGILRFIDARKSLSFDLGLCLAALFVLTLIRLFEPIAFSKRVDHHAIEVLAFGSAALIVIVIGVLSIGLTRVFWPDSLWIAAALFIHPYLKDVGRILLRGLRALVWSGASGKRPAHVS